MRRQGYHYNHLKRTQHTVKKQTNKKNPQKTQNQKKKKRTTLFTVENLNTKSWLLSLWYFQGLLIKWGSSRQGSKHRGQSSLSYSRASPRAREGLQWQMWRVCERRKREAAQRNGEGTVHERRHSQLSSTPRTLLSPKSRPLWFLPQARPLVPQSRAERHVTRNQERN